jgi:NitT/TauT family transport system ATP-binding protein
MIRVKNVGKTYRHNDTCVEALRAMSIDVNDGELVALIGPSGCGKTTLLNLVAGFDWPTSGEINVNGHQIDSPGPERVLIFQNSALFPWLKLEENLFFSAGSHSPEKRAQVQALCNRFGLAEFLTRWPRELSGGMAKVAEFIRAVAANASVILADEAFGELDEWSRQDLQVTFQEFLVECPTTCLFVTHSVDEAIFLADRVLVCSARPGRILADVAVDIPKPRTAEIRLQPDFLSIRANIMNVLRETR